ncbi:hypothetical protein [Marilutibacter alkalisoli]|uniref:DUF3379 domain-containing protein n=1 Tax=Marilutibacter alkalisoli TaxID=2591633 RepID=A0A514BTW4_9GAMM|nr:hypothetical protein [Lysobacter alkalisoli]QDH70833.1 hypothetical protein FKV23_12640 [Lysobacter alkalisoli]
MTHDSDIHRDTPFSQPVPLPDTLRWQLRGLRQEHAPGRDLWPGIANRLPPRDAIAAAPRRRKRWPAPLAMAASLLLVVGMLVLGRPGWDDLRSPDNTAPQVADAATAPSPLARETAGLSEQYQAAFREIGPVPDDNPMRPVIDELDRNASQILTALAEQPDSRLLFEQLRRTYARRLAVSQRLIHA